MEQNNQNYSQLVEIDNNNINDIEIENKKRENIIDLIVLNTYNKIIQNKNKLLNITFYSSKIDQIDQINYDLENIVFNLIVSINDIVVKGDYDKNILEVFYIFDIKKIIYNEILINNNIIDIDNTYIFQHNFLFENENIEIFDFIFNNDIAILIDNENNINLQNIDLENEILYFHIEYLPDDFDINLNNIHNTLNYQSIDFILYKIQFKQIFIKINFILNFISQNINDIFFKYLFLKEFSDFLNIENKFKNNELIQFKENCLIEGEKINIKFNELKTLIDENKNNILIINYMKLIIMEILT